MAHEIVTVADALRWVNKLKQVESEGVQVLMVQHLIAAEREACAKIAEDPQTTLRLVGCTPAPFLSDDESVPDRIRRLIAAAIRARGAK